MASKSTGVNVLRWSALGLGVFYGIYHQRSITAAQRAAAEAAEYKHKEELIAKAKAAYAKQKAAQQQQQQGTAPVKSSGLDQDPMSPDFDLEAYFEALMQLKE
ncbi:uncharacterized protein CTHT_0056980 [Thermochaetoides thermophila DSM 1495]|uniref:ATP synthase F(0) complex subunit e, mitochondrial n=1 Tax=Chaetomium thermophilum (strain DSM 1495 / CBS 144.50 / IMI 039719) TaxID=759272 RepID=G0SCF0_CHATD|nr:hypothetical protein CTHT_0056980 [Thermochaetoides thermophila DSM 1495]EGS19076.1 hypothetical protein CTHT_0056980 [Thermochaetoides thermophila DSM 1495]